MVSNAVVRACPAPKNLGAERIRGKISSCSLRLRAFVRNLLKKGIDIQKIRHKMGFRSYFL
jgi:hypothetical protein